MSIFSRRRDRRYAELDEEIRAHFRMAVEERIARGESRADAELAVRREFGNVAHVKEVTRDMWGGVWFERLLQDVRYAFRSLRRTPAFTLVAVLTLCLGIGANTAVFTVLNGVLLRPLPFSEPSRLALVSYGPPADAFIPTPGMTDRHYVQLTANAPMFGQLATFGARPVTLTGACAGGGLCDPLRLRGAEATTGFFSLLGVPATVGRTFAPDEGAPGKDAIVVLSERIWRSRFAADPAIVGTKIVLDGTPKLVVGVMPASFDFPSGVDAWMPMEVRIDPHNEYRRPVIGRLRDGLGIAQARAAFVTMAKRFEVDTTERRPIAPEVRPLSAFLVGQVQRSLLVFAGAVAFVLLIACANVANLLLMRAASREREIAVRAALGASRRRIVRQLLTESVLIGLVGGAAGAVLAFWGVRLLLALAPEARIPRVESIHVDLTVLGFALLLSFLTGIAFGLVPALHATRRQLRESLAESARTLARSQGRLRGALVVAEMALALVLLAGAGLLLRSFRAMRAVDPGFRPASVLTMTVDLPDADYPAVGQMKALHEKVVAELSRLPGVDAAASVNWLPFGPALITGTFRIDVDPTRSPGYVVDKMATSPGYFAAMGIRLLRGRDFTAQDRANASRVVIVSRSVADRSWPNQNPIGKRLTQADNPTEQDWLTVVGVADDITQQSVLEPAHAAIYQPYAQMGSRFFLGHVTYVVRSSGDRRAIATAMRNVLRSADRNLPLRRVESMDEIVSAETQEPLFQTRLLGVFSLLALVLAAVGIYGVLAYGVTERRHEFGIRMALGAQAKDVMAGVMRGTLALALPGIALGAVGAIVVTRVLDRFLFVVTARDPLTLATVATVLAATAVLAGWLPARRAAHVDPATALRSE